MPASGNSLFPHPYDLRLTASQVGSYSSQQLAEKTLNRKQDMWNYWCKWMQCHWNQVVALLCTTSADSGSMPSAHYGNWKLCGHPCRGCAVSLPVSLLRFVRYSQFTIKRLFFLLLWWWPLTPSLWWKTPFLTETGHSRVMELHFKLVLYPEKKSWNLSVFLSLKRQEPFAGAVLRWCSQECFDSKSICNLGNFI